jgi:hypothetical protein
MPLAFMCVNKLPNSIIINYFKFVMFPLYKKNNWCGKMSNALSLSHSLLYYFTERKKERKRERKKKQEIVNNTFVCCTLCSVSLRFMLSATRILLFIFIFLFYRFHNVQLSCKSNKSLECREDKKSDVMEVKLATLKAIHFFSVWGRGGKLHKDEIFFPIFCALVKCSKISGY